MAAYRLVLLSVLCTTCIASSSSKPNGVDASVVREAAGLVPHSDDSIKIDAIEPILSTLSSWMTEERKKGAKRRREFNDDLRRDGSILPFVTLAYAQTLDGMIAARNPDGETTTSNLALSDPQSKVLTHRLRSMHDAILVGGATFLLDQPRLNVRLPREHAGMYDIDHPIPVVLDTNLRSLQRLLFGGVVSEDSSSKEDVPDIATDTIRAERPVICCSTGAAQSFLDILEEFQEQQATKRKPKRRYKITVYKKIDADDPTNDYYQPIKISMQVTQHRKHEEDAVEELTLTLLPCLADENTKRISIRHMLHQLSNHFEIESVMVEGGAGILSSFLNENEVIGHTPDGEGSDGESRAGKVVNCVCATIAPKVLGGKRGLPAFGGLDIPDHDDGAKEEADGSMPLGARLMVAIKDGVFVPLGQDCTFLGRI
ncbi:hypothetical protein ACHAXT_001947 [Thalassiosira profunda]